MAQRPQHLGRGNGVPQSLGMMTGFLGFIQTTIRLSDDTPPCGSGIKTSILGPPTPLTSFRVILLRLDRSIDLPPNMDPSPLTGHDAKRILDTYHTIPLLVDVPSPSCGVTAMKLSVEIYKMFSVPSNMKDVTCRLPDVTSCAFNIPHRLRLGNLDTALRISRQS